MSPLYPTPKTQQQREDDDRRRQERLRSRLPKAPWCTLPLFGMGVFWTSTWFVQIFPGMWSVGHIAFVFFSFAMWLGVSGLGIWWGVYTNKLLYAYGASRWVFWCVCLMVLGCLFALHGTGVLSDQAQRPVYTALFGAFLMVYALLALRKGSLEKK